MYAVIRTGGKQYRVEEGDRIRVEKLDGDVGAELSFDDVLMVGGDKVAVGTPTVSGASVKAKIVAQDRAKKVIVFKYKARKGYRKKYGHRQPYTELEIMELAEMASPSVIAASESTASAGLGVSAARTQYIPSLRLSSGYNWQNQQASFQGGSTSWNMSLSLSYPIFNGFQRESSIDRAQYTLRVSRLQEDDARLAAREQADAALQSLLTAEQAILIAQDAAFVAAEDLRVVRERYSVGAATILDVLVSQNAATQADVDVVTARYDYILARAELEAILGREL